MACGVPQVLQQGEVAQAGSHAELLEEGGLYSTMWSRQQQDHRANHHNLPPGMGAAGGSVADLLGLGLALAPGERGGECAGGAALAVCVAWGACVRGMERRNVCRDGETQGGQRANGPTVSRRNCWL